MSSNPGDVKNPDSIVLMHRLLQVAAVEKRKAAVEKIAQLSDREVTDYSPYILGNDGPLTSDQLNHHRMDKHFVLVGTALLRSVQLACVLAPKDDVPEVVIVDNSEKAAEAWIKIKQFFEGLPDEAKWSDIFTPKGGPPHSHTNSCGAFTKFVYDLIIRDDLIDFAGEYDVRHIRASLMEHLPKTANIGELRRFRNVIANVVVLTQSWGDLETFKSLKRVYAGIPIVAYPSNIVEYLRDQPEQQINVLKCVDELKPCLSLHTNFDLVERRPTSCYVFEDNCPLVMANALNVCERVKASMALHVESSLIAGMASVRLGVDASRPVFRSSESRSSEMSQDSDFSSPSSAAESPRVSEKSEKSESKNPKDESPPELEGPGVVSQKRDLFG